ncbi:MAG: MATE family efflux transporter [Gammaproteobacteria bacterium]|nr:MATE family efflux transporter [Gammaproteobacteria bacterium]
MIRRELSQLFRLALPMILTQLSQMGMGVADTIMAGRVSAADLAGVALGGNLFWPVLLFISGIIMSITPSVSQLHGAGRQKEAGEVVRQSLWVAAVGGGLLFVILRNVEPLYHMIGVDPLAIPISVAYLNALSWGLMPLLGYFAMRYLCEGMSWALPAMLIAFSGLLLKIPLNYLFIYGGFGIPAMGGEGCGWSSAIVMWYELIAISLVVAFSRIKVTGIFNHFSMPDIKEIGRLVNLGLPIGATMFLEMSMFSVVTLLIGRLGVEAVAAHQIAGNVGGMTFMVPLALGMAASIRVGFNVGSNDLPGARRSGWVAISVSLAFAAVAAVAVFFSRDFIAGLYSTELPVLLLAVDLLLFVVVYQFFDDAQVTAIGALRGFKDTRTPMWVAMVAYWLIGLPVGIAVGFGWLPVDGFLGVRGFWVGLVVGLVVAAAILVLRFRWLSGKEIRIREFAAR